MHDPPVPGQDRVSYRQVLDRYGADGYTDFGHDRLLEIGREEGYDAVESVARHELVDRWDVDHPLLHRPLSVDTVEGAGSRAFTGAWAVQIDVDGTDVRSPVGALYHEIGHKIDGLLMRMQGRDDYPRTYRDVIAAEMKATLALSRFDTLLDRCTERADAGMRYLQDRYRIRNGGGSSLYGPDMAEPPERDDDAWRRFLQDEGFGGHYLGYGLAARARETGCDEAELVREGPATLCDRFADTAAELRDRYRDPFSYDRVVDWRPAAPG